MNNQKPSFNNLPEELKLKIIEYLLYKCPLCHKDKVYFDNQVIKCFTCKKHYCKNHSLAELNSSICYDCFEEKKDNLYHELLEGIEGIANICRTS